MGSRLLQFVVGRASTLLLPTLLRLALRRERRRVLTELLWSLHYLTGSPLLRLLTWRCTPLAWMARAVEATIHREMERLIRASIRGTVPYPTNPAMTRETVEPYLQRMLLQVLKR